MEYRSKVEKDIEVWLVKYRNKATESFIENVFWFYSHTLERAILKVRENKNAIHHLYSITLELQDILRSVLLSQVNLLLTQSALNLRVSFEITTNLKYILQYHEPLEMCKRLSSFAQCERIIGMRLTPFLHDKNEGAYSEEMEKVFAETHIYWKNKKTGLLSDNPKWNGEGLSLKQIAEQLNLNENYINMYRIPSMFIHGSPATLPIFETDTGYSILSNPAHTTRFNLMCTHLILTSIFEKNGFCSFFGIEFDQNEFEKLVDEFNAVSTKLRGLELVP